MDLDLSPEDLRFRDAVREFLRDHLPAHIRRAQRLAPTVFTESEISGEWHRILYRKGWVAPHWPAAFGGPGWTAAQKYIFQTECARAGAPLTAPMSLYLVGPVLMRFGSAEQQQRYLPRILSGEDYWCQGFSEPGAGSDLASLRLKAVTDGAHYVLNGSKIWTTHAHCANRMFALVRTAETPKPQHGISFLLLDMASPGLSVRPILTIGGDHEVNQVFFDDVRVPIANRVGAEGQGWEIAKYLLEFERGSVNASSKLRAGLTDVLALAEQQGGDAEILAAIAEVAMDIDALEMMELQVMSALSGGQNPGNISSVLKLRASQLKQAVSELAVDVLGPAALRWETRRPLHALPFDSELADLAVSATSRYLNSRADTIFGGSAEIQKGIITKTILGL